MTTRGTGASDFAFFSSGAFSELSVDFGAVFLFLGGIFVSIAEIYSREKRRASTESHVGNKPVHVSVSEKGERSSGCR